MVQQPMDDTTMHIQLSGNSRLSCTSLQHTDSPPSHFIVQLVSSTHAFRFGYLGFRGNIAACELKHRSGKTLFKALRCDRGIALYANFSCLFAFGGVISTSYTAALFSSEFLVAVGLATGGAPPSETEIWSSSLESPPGRKLSLPHILELNQISASGVPNCFKMTLTNRRCPNSRASLT
ncbi:hypothetical protein AVEN_224145-1 [Araneus ventricosus]|uniref:Uncharacterized protein n=1 Tax=Araneus ventricosus TaxID=182803 RepID=A0A4Y2HDE8_ARAVE|nr:hypothetical protein AVEN_224145-1 [Araneus ventricosus]